MYLHKSSNLFYYLNLKTPKYTKYVNVFVDEYGMAIPCEEDDDDTSVDFTDCFEGDTGGDMDDSDNQGAEMSNLEYYIELLYEELSDKVKGARFIARLAKMPENLIAIANHGKYV